MRCAKSIVLVTCPPWGRCKKKSSVSEQIVWAGGTFRSNSRLCRYLRLGFQDSDSPCIPYRQTTGAKATPISYFPTTKVQPCLPPIGVGSLPRIEDHDQILRSGSPRLFTALVARTNPPSLRHAAAGEGTKRDEVCSHVRSSLRRGAPGEGAEAMFSSARVGVGVGAEACSSINSGRPGALLGSSVAFGSGCG